VRIPPQVDVVRTLGEARLYSDLVCQTFDFGDSVSLFDVQGELGWTDFQTSFVPPAYVKSARIVLGVRGLATPQGPTGTSTARFDGIFLPEPGAGLAGAVALGALVWRRGRTRVSSPPRPPCS
jgi:hypothetical protein